MLAKQFRYPFTEGIPPLTVVTPFFIMRYKKNTLSHLRVAVVVSKRVDKRATVRNKIKRKFLDVIHTSMKEHTLPYDVVFYVRPKAVMLDNLEKTIMQTFIKSTIITQ